MTRDELANLMRRIDAYYPRWRTPVAALDDWAEDLVDVTVDEANAAWRRWRQNRNPFPPNAGDLRAHVEALRPAEDDDAYRRRRDAYFASLDADRREQP